MREAVEDVANSKYYQKAYLAKESMECGGKAGVLIHGTYRPQSTNEVEAFSDANSMFLTEQEFEPFVPNLAAEEAD